MLLLQAHFVPNTLHEPPIRTLHVMGTSDNLVSVTDSMRVL